MVKSGELMDDAAGRHIGWGRVELLQVRLPKGF